MKHYILVDRQPVSIEIDIDTQQGREDLRRWGQWFEEADRQVAVSRFFGAVVLSTVFLGLDHQWGQGPPLLFESMAFWFGEGGDCFRCATWAEAEEQHARMCAQVLNPRAYWNELVELCRQTWRTAMLELRAALTGVDHTLALRSSLPVTEA